MFKLKPFVSILVTVLLVTIQATAAYAASPKDTPTPAPTPAPTSTPTTVTGTVQSVTTQTDPTTGAIIVVATITDSTGATQTVDLSLASAISLGLVTQDATTGAVTVNNTEIGQSITIDSSMILTSGGTTTQQQPVASAIANFFSSLLGIDYQTVIGFHDQGVGFGEIAQACFMSFQLNGDGKLCGTILQDKQSGDFSNITLPDGTTATATNWGQFKKEVDAKGNLGWIMSGNTDMPQGNGNGNGSANGNENPGNGNGNNVGNGNNGHGHGHGNGNGGGNGHGHGNGGQ